MTQALASGVSRRDTMKWVGAAVVGTMISGLGVRSAEADVSPACNAGVGTCGQCAPRACTNHGGGTCFCTRFVRNGICTGHAACVQNFFCSQARACSTIRDCKPLGHNWFCGDQACCPGPRGACVAYCGTVPACCTVSGAGLTATG